MAFVLGIFRQGAEVPRAALLGALGLQDDGSAVFEVGRAETGATLVLTQEESGAWQVQIPLVRSPTSAEDLLPPLVACLESIGAWLDVLLPPPPPGRLPAPRSAGELLAAWRTAHQTACANLIRLCAAQGLPPPPHMPAEDLRRLHGWLLAVATRPDVIQPILGLDPANGEQTRLVVVLPESGQGVVALPPVQEVLKNVDGETRSFALGAVGQSTDDGFLLLDLAAVPSERAGLVGRSIGTCRIVSPVEIVDAEALGAAGPG